VLDQLHRPLFRPREGGVDEGFCQVELSACQQVLGKNSQDLHQRAFTHPLLESTMASLIRRKLVSRQLRPLRSSSQNPQHAFEDGARVGPGSSTSLAGRLGFNQRLQYLPLHIGKLHDYRCACKFNFAQLLNAIRIYEIGSSNKQDVGISHSLNTTSCVLNWEDGEAQ